MKKSKTKFLIFTSALMQVQNVILGIAGYITPCVGFQHLIAAKAIGNGIYEIHFKPGSGTSKSDPEFIHTFDIHTN